MNEDSSNRLDNGSSNYSYKSRDIDQRRKADELRTRQQPSKKSITNSLDEFSEEHSVVGSQSVSQQDNLFDSELTEQFRPKHFDTQRKKYFYFICVFVTILTVTVSQLGKLNKSNITLSEVRNNSAESNVSVSTKSELTNLNESEPTGKESNTKGLEPQSTTQAIFTESTELIGHTQTVDSLCFSPDGKHLASGSWDQTIKIWDTTTGELLRTLVGHTNFIDSVRYSPNSELLASGSSDGTVKLWNANNGKELATLSGHTDKVWAVAFSSDSSLVASGGPDGSIRIHSTTDGQFIRSLATTESFGVTSLSFSPDQNLLVSGTDSGNIYVWNPSTGEKLARIFAHEQAINSVDFSSSGEDFLTGSFDQTIKLWKIGAYSPSKTFKAHTSKVFTVCFAPDGKKFISSGADDKVFLWDTESDEPISVLPYELPNLYSIAFSPIGDQIAIGGKAKIIQLWKFDAFAEGLESCSNFFNSRNLDMPIGPKYKWCPGKDSNLHTLASSST